MDFLRINSLFVYVVSVRIKVSEYCNLFSRLFIEGENAVTLTGGLGNGYFKLAHFFYPY